MDSHRRRIAGLVADFIPTQILQQRAHAAATTGAAEATSTISPYHSNLAGVNQPVNMLFKDMLWASFGGMAIVVLVITISRILWAQLRHVSAMSVEGERQNYWKTAQWNWMPSLKKHLMYAPLWNKRHNKEIKLSSAIGIGTLPSRMHSVILGFYIASNMIYMFFLNWENANLYSFCAELRGRSGTLSVVNMVPLIILAGRNNPLIGMLHVSFDTYNLLHRWVGRMSVIEAVLHTIAWLIVQIADSGWDGVWHRMSNELFIGSGMAGTLALIVIMILSFSPVRHAFYETFLNVHIILAFFIFLMTYIHCAVAGLPGGLPQLPWMIAIFILWFLERMARIVRVAYMNWSDRGTTDAIVEAVPGECTRVTMNLPRYVDVKPGTHAYLRFKDIRPWDCHPFSIGWVEHIPDHRSLPLGVDEEKATLTAIDKKNTTTSISFIIGAQSGFTRDLYNVARQSGDRAIRMKACVEGPYSGHHSLDSYGHAVLFAGATGITHGISYLKPLIDGYNNGSVATRRITLVWIVRDYEALEWVRPWMDTILRLPNRKDILRIQLYITRPQNSQQIVSASNTVQMFPGRPNIPLIMKREVSEQQGAMCVHICGPGALADDVRSAVREVQDEGTVVDFVEESFTW
ncbi:ferric reductase like transmembrane component [Colletotrichum scovillei]|uniref:Ferric reductase like transmembrane component n=2 Tax=Colletotrichum acutatum species complex TaxID=2707335 RepID=A0A9P7QZW4_9PEZI|nr:ferric reductase like transmembrane component [Colletotrichum scovillei]KXH25390.1 ferric reductase like transmembrane component [Colletotrichum nymphaeae SA-01]KAF4779428.1 ferric reductase like transmembrane component [Colletotrichum scovillei]KAG7046875.1 ferric reductase like transmembrane component [Colletotrichum scovillei]KAG7056715.1 ferric reductase like transmembrane component [Colletotrichum scovillei]KAG7066642.1 ferric reductase like transmembrane component [Colletotrichum scov